MKTRRPHILPAKCTTTMLKFLSRDSSNAKVLVNLERKSDSLSVKSKAKTAVVSKIGRSAFGFTKQVAAHSVKYLQQQLRKEASFKNEIDGTNKTTLVILETNRGHYVFSVAPWLCEWDIHLTSDAFDIPKTTIRSWLNDQSLKPYTVQQIILASTGQIWKNEVWCPPPITL